MGVVNELYKELKSKAGEMRDIKQVKVSQNAPIFFYDGIDGMYERFISIRCTNHPSFHATYYEKEGKLYMAEMSMAARDLGAFIEWLEAVKAGIEDGTIKL